LHPSLAADTVVASQSKRRAAVHVVRAALGSEAKDVLVLSRKIGERILIGDKITITVVKIGHGGVRIGVDAPPELAVVREELAIELRRAEQALAQQSETVAE
jgi:carbon storage regulator